jgi:putative PIN family toxin of toxin-antitoxin system
MIRLVIDTNILVSALLQPEGLPAAVFMLVLSRDLQLCISEAIFAEYDEVIRRPRFKRPVDVIEGTLLSIRRLGHWVEPSVRVEECTDPDDNVFLECAQAAEADYLVTANQRHFPERWKKTQVVSARELIELLMLKRGK